MIRLSLLPTSHPLGFQPKWVRSFTQFDPRFNLLMGRSLGFASGTHDQFALFRLGFPMASSRKLLTGPYTPTRRIIMQKARRHTLNRAPTACKRMVSGSFPPLVGVLFIFRSPYSFTIGHQRVFSLTGWSPWIQSGFHVTRPTQVPLGRLLEFRLQDYHLLWCAFPVHFYYSATL